MQLETVNASPGDWVVVSGHSPEDLNPHFIKIGASEKLPALFEGKRMMVRCPQIEGGRATVYVNDDRVGVLVVDS